MTVTVYKAKDGYRWRAKSRNGRIVAESGEAYVRKAACILAYERFVFSAPIRLSPV